MIFGTRRAFLAMAAAAGPAAAAFPGTQMRISLSAGSIGVKADQLQAIELAHQFGFEAVEADSGYLRGLSGDGIKRLADDLRAKNLTWALAGLPVEFRKTDEDFRASLPELPSRCKALQKAGVTRMTTWLSPASDTLTYRANFDQHARRLREVAAICGDHGIRFGMEYVGPKTLWAARRYPFIHTMAETKDLIAEIGKNNVGFVLDSWHWYTAGDTVADLLALKPSDVVSVDLNDAPANVPVDQQIDSKREIPCATGVIDVSAFLNALNKIGCDAPVRCEPFNAALRQMPRDQALETTINAMKKAFGLIRG